MAISFGQYYNDNCTQLVLQLAKKIGSLEEAEDRVQNVFMSLLPRKEFYEELIEKGELEKYIQGAINKQPAQMYREQHRQVPTISLEERPNFLSWFTKDRQDNSVMDEVELNSFFDYATKCLANPRKLTSDCGFDTVGELRQYIFIQYCRNGRTFEEIGGLVGCSLQNIFLHYGRIITILTPMLEKYLGVKLVDMKKELKDWPY